MSPLFGMRIVPNELCVSMRPVKVHKKRRNQRDAYHRRVQKKWVKRFGQESSPCAYKLADGTIVAHPSIVAKLRAAARSEAP
jgi:hypothetical protein